MWVFEVCPCKGYSLRDEIAIVLFLADVLLQVEQAGTSAAQNAMRLHTVKNNYLSRWTRAGSLFQERNEAVQFGVAAETFCLVNSRRLRDQIIL